jgi:hypothetical protein
LIEQRQGFLSRWVDRDPEREHLRDGLNNRMNGLRDFVGKPKDIFSGEPPDAA